jgi:GNAT superfamily N-acetyltransferase
MRDLRIVGDEAEVPPAVVALDELTYASWGGPLPLPQYLLRERRLRAAPFSRGLRVWILREGAQVLASCESYEVPLVHHAPGARAPLRGPVHGIASVYVEPRLRGHGHASALLQGVHEHLLREGALGTYLMSEIGPTLYARLGYVERPLRYCRYAAADPAREHLPTPLPWTWLGEADVAPMLGERYRHARPALTLEASIAQIGWHLLHGRFYAEACGKPPSATVGARVGDAFALWQPSHHKQLLRVLMLYPGARLATPGAPISPRGPELEVVRQVLHAARFAAAEQGLPHIEVWENPSNNAYLRGGARLAAGEVPMLRPLRREVRGEDWLDYERCHWI